MSLKALAITFDSNVWEELVLQEKLEKHACKADLEVIKEAINNTSVKPYISDVILILEAVRKSDRAKFLQSFLLSKKTKDEGFQRISGEGLPVYQQSITMTTSFDHPDLSAQVSKAFNAALDLGFQLIKVNRIGFPMVDLKFYKLLPTTSDQSKKDILGEFRKLNLGCAQAEKRGEEMKRNHLNLLNVPAIIAFAFGEEEPVPKLVSEWADGDALIAHYWHGHDYFCTLDQGKGAGTQSVLHKSRRDWLLQEFDIKIVSPTELAQIILN